MTEKIGIIDLGTNTFHLLLAEMKDGSIKIFHRDRQAVKIGKAGINQGMITDEAVARALLCLQHFKEKLEREKVTRVHALGTSALRSATNGKQVIHKIKEETGIDVEIISGNQEAEYIYLGIRSAMDLGLEKSLIVDIGGGSVEFIVCDREKIYWKQSVDIGAQRLLEQFHRHDPMLPEEMVRLNEHYRQALIPMHRALEEFNPDTLVGSSGTFDTLSEIYCRRNRISFLPEDTETPLTPEGFQEIHNDLIGRNRTERMKIPGMIDMRVDMIVVASCLIHYLLAHFSFSKIRVSTYSLKEGVLATLAKDQLP